MLTAPHGPEPPWITARLNVLLRNPVDLFGRTEQEVPMTDTLPQIQPMLARSIRDINPADTEAILRNPNWVAEEKLDGVRQKLHVGFRGNRLDGRNRSRHTRLCVERTDNFPEWRDLPLSGLAGTVFDGEVVSGDRGASLPATIAVVNSGAERSRNIQARNGRPLYHVFDIIRDRGDNVTETLRDRRRRLEQIFEDHASVLASAGVVLVPQSRDARALYAAVVARGGEGIMVKDLNGTYAPGKRVTTMLKWKREETVDGWISGYTPADPESAWAGTVGALLVSVHDAASGAAVEVGSVIPGDMEQRRAMSADDGSLRPEWYGRVVEVRGQSWTKNRRLSHCVLVRFRPDKSPTQCALHCREESPRA